MIRSRKLIEQALLDTLMNQGIKGLSVKNVTQRAGINRGTFYLHYKDIFDLIEQTEIMRGLLDIFEPIELNELMKHEDEELPFPPFAKAFEYLQTHTYFLKAVFHSSAPSELKERLQFLVGTRWYENLKQDQLNAEWSPTYPPGYLIAYLDNAQFGLIQHWFMKDQSLPPAEIARLLTRFIKRTPCLSYHFESENKLKQT